MRIKTISQLREVYGSPTGRSKSKEFSSLDKHAINFIKKSPFIVLSTSDKNGKHDASPRGGAPGFVLVRDDKTIVIPDAKGNNRVDSLSNIVETGKAGLLFVIPGMDETLRINGSAYISTDIADLKLFVSENKPLKSCVFIQVEEMFLHCAKAFMRSKLWQEESRINRSDMPSMGEMLKDQLQSIEPAETHEAMVKRYQKDL